MRLTAALCAVLFACGSSDDGRIAIDIHWTEPMAEVSPRLLGHNAVWSRGGLGLWDETAHAIKPDVEPLVTALHPGMLRFPGGTRAMLYHFEETIGPLADRKPQCDTFTGELDSTSWGMDEALQFADRIGAEVSLVSPWHDGTPERAAAMVAYANATTESTAVIGVDANGTDWGNAADWAARRAANGHPAPYRVPMLEVGNEPYLDLPTGKDVCGTTHPYTQAERLENGVYIPSTARDVAEQVARTAQLIKQVDPTILVGAPALTDVLGMENDPATALSDVDRDLGTGDAWNPTLLAAAGDAFDFLVLHIYSFGAMPDRVRLADQLRDAIDKLRGLGAKAFAITEFGTLFDAETQLNALISADFVRVAAEEGALASLRHILIEDEPSGLFANSAAILGEQHELTPGYHAMAALAEAVQPIAVRWTSPEPEVVVLATRDEASSAIGLAIIDRRLAMTPIDLAVPLPAGTWDGELMIESASSVTGLDTTVERSEVHADGELAITLPPSGLAVVRLTRK
ncbi:MAG TPA: hypothetical protein VFS15_11900 [Kofleriaceae bacterium]|nr:hypothetical protein [Kofleriaceae bacterium]